MIVTGVFRPKSKLMECVQLYEDEVRARGFQDRSSLFHPGERVQRYYAWRIDGSYLSFLAFERFHIAKILRIIGAWTAPQYRRKGLYGRLFNQMVEDYTDRGFCKIKSGYHRDNMVSASMQANRGSVLVGVDGSYVKTEHHLNSFDQ